MGLTDAEAKTLLFVFALFFTGLLLKYFWNYDKSKFETNFRKENTFPLAKEFFSKDTVSKEKFSAPKVEYERKVLDFSNNNKKGIVKRGNKAEKEKIDINSAGVKELTKIPFVGKATAEKIIRLRKKLGGFKKPEDLLKVKGIGRKKLEKIKSFIKLNN